MTHRLMRHAALSGKERDVQINGKRNKRKAGRNRGDAYISAKGRHVPFLSVDVLLRWEKITLMRYLNSFGKYVVMTCRIVT